MRLIDANKLTDLYDHLHPQSEFNDAIDYISFNAPVVDAIPIDWIEKVIKSYEGLNDATCYFYAKLLQRWRKENETK